MKKRLTCWILVILLMLPLSVPASAHDKKEHDQTIESVLFGNKNYKKGLDESSQEYKKIDNLEKAVALCLDQYNGNYKDELKELKDCKIHGLPKKIDDIDFSSNQHHRRMTHMGWNAVYPEKAHWEKRQAILLQTVNDVFSFKPKAGKWTFGVVTVDFGYKEQCKAFAEFLYYLHILGEYVPGKEAEDTKDKRLTMYDMIPPTRQHPGEGNEDIFWELKRILPIISEASVKTSAYKGLETDIKKLEQDARKLGDMNKENFQQYSDIINELLDHLKSKMPNILKEEPFFKKAFYN